MMTRMRPSTPADGARVLDIWRSAVDATHQLLSPVDRKSIAREVEAFLPSAPAWLAVDADDHAVGFMLLTDGHMDALFVDAVARGSGIGRLLVEHALQHHPALTTDVKNRTHRRLAFTSTWALCAPGALPWMARAEAIR